MNNPRRTYLLVSLSALAFFIFYLFAQGFFPGEEARVKRVILAGRRAIEARDIFACAEMTSRQYHDTYGNDRSSIIYIGKNVFDYYPTIIIYIESMDISVSKDRTRADVRVQATAVGKSRDDRQENILEKGKGHFLVRLAKEDKKWRVTELEFFDPVGIMGQEVS